MKPNLYLACCFALALASGCQTSTDEPRETKPAVSMTGSEVWDRTIAYHDPQNKWTEFTGAVRIVTYRRSFHGGGG